MIVSDNGALSEILPAIGRADFLALDTEFIRDRTYWPRLCLIQIAWADGEAAVIDPLAEGLDLTEFFRLLAGPQQKVLHAARQDVEVLLHHAQCLPAPLFDTQIAAQACGYNESVGYPVLAEKLAGVKIDKAARMTNWARRPLGKAQIAYALSDVVPLRTIYRCLRDQLEAQGRTGWVTAAMQELLDPSLYNTDPDRAWERLKPKSSEPRYQAILRELAAWREHRARKRNIPRGWVLRDDAILELASRKPDRREQLQELRHFGRAADSGSADEILAVIAKALQQAPPASAAPARPGPRHPPPDDALLRLLRVLLSALAQHHRLAPSLLAGAGQLEALAAGVRDDLEILSGWRAELFGQDALALCEGRLALRPQKGRVQLLELREGSWEARPL